MCEQKSQDFQSVISNVGAFGSDFKEEGHWVWSDGTPFGYTNWGDNEGSHGPGQNCIAMETHTPSTSIPRGKWHDLGCFDSHPFVCEIDLNISWNLQTLSQIDK